MAGKRKPKDAKPDEPAAAPDTKTAPVFGQADAEAAATATVEAVNASTSKPLSASEVVDMKTGEIERKPALMATFERMAELLEEPLTTDDLRQAKGVKGDFLPGAAVLKELNRVFGRGGWTSTLLSVNPSPVDVDERKENGTNLVVRRYSLACWTHARVGIGSPSMPAFWREDVGVHQAAAQPTLGQAYDLAIKGSATDAIKRAASQIADRMGLVLRFKEEERENEGLLGPTKDDERPPVKPKPTSSPSTSGQPATNESGAAKAGAGSSAASASSSQAGAASKPDTKAGASAGDVKLDPGVQAAKWLLEGKLPAAVTKLLKEGHGPASTGLPEGVALPGDPKDEDGLAALGWPDGDAHPFAGRAKLYALPDSEPVSRDVLVELHKLGQSFVGGDVKRLWSQLGVELTPGVKVSGYVARLFAASVAVKKAK